MPLLAANFKTSIRQKQTGLFFLEKENISCAITNYGARLVQLLVPDKDQQPLAVVLGYPSLDDYRQQPEDYMGAIVGRCANRIAGAAFELDGLHYELAPNEGPNLLHSGPDGLHSRVWQVAQYHDDELTLSYLSPHGEGGFPGDLEVRVTYRLEAPATLAIHYRATTSRPTLINLSNHAYWNLSGEGCATAMDHLLSLHARAFTPTDPAQIPTGAITPVNDSPFDFRKAKMIGQDINASHPQLGFGKGYDHNFVLDGTGFREALCLFSPRSQIRMRLFTDQPGLQFYSGNFLDGSRSGISGRPYGFRSALALEPQHFPDAVHHPHFPTVALWPDQVFESSSRYVFD